MYTTGFRRPRRAYTRTRHTSLSAALKTKHGEIVASKPWRRAWLCEIGQCGCYMELVEF
jgi:hypothetical protein